MKINIGIWTVSTVLSTLLLVSCMTDSSTPWNASDVCPDAPGTLLDERDGKGYKTVKIGTQTWMAENLNYISDNSFCYDDADSNCSTYGRLYDYSTAVSSCPSGWHLPSDDEWNDLAEAMGGMDKAGLRLKATKGWENDGSVNNVNGTDDCQFSALPAGEGGLNTGYRQNGYWGYWWSSSQYDGPWAGVRVIISFDNEMAENTGHDAWEYIAVRCVLD